MNGEGPDKLISKMVRIRALCTAVHTNAITGTDSTNRMRRGDERLYTAERAQFIYLFY